MNSMQIYIIRQLCLKYQKFSGPETKALLLRYLVFNLFKKKIKIIVYYYIWPYIVLPHLVSTYAQWI